MTCVSSLAPHAFRLSGLAIAPACAAFLLTPSRWPNKRATTTPTWRRLQMTPHRRQCILGCGERVRAFSETLANIWATSWPHFEYCVEEAVNVCEKTEFGAVQKCVNLVDLEINQSFKYHIVLFAEKEPFSEHAGKCVMLSICNNQLRYSRE